jgi:hypothetical protein
MASAITHPTVILFLHTAIAQQKRWVCGALGLSQALSMKPVTRFIG